jgi:hypothetical protein
MMDILASEGSFQRSMFEPTQPARCAVGFNGVPFSIALNMLSRYVEQISSSDRCADELSSLNSIVIPEMLARQKVESMRPREKQKYIEHVILEVLKRNPRGVTISELQAKTPFARNTLMKHLNRLVATRQASRLDRGKISIYYRNGSVQNAVDFRDKTDLDHLYTFMQLENEDGQFVYIQEKEVDEFRSIKVKGGIMINATVAPEFLAKLREFIFQMEES